MRLWTIISEKDVVTLDKDKLEEVLRELVTHLSKSNRRVKAQELLARLLDREKLGSTAIGHGIAIPHCKLEGLKEPVLVLGLSKRGIDKWSTDGKPVQAVFLVVTSPEDPNVNLRTLAVIAQLARKSRDLAARLVKAPDVAAVMGLIKMEEERESE